MSLPPIHMCDSVVQSPSLPHVCICCCGCSWPAPCSLPPSPQKPSALEVSADFPATPQTPHRHRSVSIAPTIKDRLAEHCAHLISPTVSSPDSSPDIILWETSPHMAMHVCTLEFRVWHEIDVNKGSSCNTGRRPHQSSDTKEMFWEFF